MKKNNQSPYSFTSRFGIIADSGTTTIPRLIVNYYAKLKIKPQLAMFIVHIYDFKWDGRNSYPSLDTVADLMGVSRRMVNYYLEDLKKKKLVDVNERFDTHIGQMTNVYDFTKLVDKVIELEKARLKNEDTSAKRRYPLKSTSTPPLKPVSTKEEEAQKEEIKNSNTRNSKNEIVKKEARRGGVQKLSDLLPQQFKQAPQGSKQGKTQSEGGGVDERPISNSPPRYNSLQPLAAKSRLEAVSDEISYKIGDTKHLRENRKQHKNIFAQVQQEKSILEADYIDLLYGVVGSVVEVIGKLEKPGAVYFHELRKRLKIGKENSQLL